MGVRFREIAGSPRKNTPLGDVDGAWGQSSSQQLERLRQRLVSSASRPLALSVQSGARPTVRRKQKEIATNFVVLSDFTRMSTACLPFCGEFEDSGNPAKNRAVSSAVAASELRVGAALSVSMNVTKTAAINLDIDRHSFRPSFVLPFIRPLFEIVDGRFMATLRQRSGFRLQHAPLVTQP